MPGKRLKDVLDDVESPNAYSDTIHTKFILLLQRIEATNPNIDDHKLRWVEARIEDINEARRFPKSVLEHANKLWKEFEPKK